MIIEATSYLEHFGVKGMRWGQRRARRKEAKQARFQMNQQRANKLINDSLKKPNDLVLLNGRTVVTGKEFVDHMAAGGLLDVSRTRSYAKFDSKKKTYVLQ